MRRSRKVNDVRRDEVHVRRGLPVGLRHVERCLLGDEPRRAGVVAVPAPSADHDRRRATSNRIRQTVGSDDREARRLFVRWARTRAPRRRRSCSTTRNLFVTARRSALASGACRRHGRSRACAPVDGRHAAGRSARASGSSPRRTRTRERPPTSTERPETPVPSGPSRVTVTAALSRATATASVPSSRASTTASRGGRTGGCAICGAVGAASALDASCPGRSSVRTATATTIPAITDDLDERSNGGAARTTPSRRACGSASRPRGAARTARSSRSARVRRTSTTPGAPLRARSAPARRPVAPSTRTAASASGREPPRGCEPDVALRPSRAERRRRARGGRRARRPPRRDVAKSAAAARTRGWPRSSACPDRVGARSSRATPPRRQPGAALGSWVRARRLRRPRARSSARP